jgi:hypothetical protein
MVACFHLLDCFRLLDISAGTKWNRGNSRSVPVGVDRERHEHPTRGLDNDLLHGFLGADSSRRGYIHTGRWVSLRPISLKVKYDIAYSHQNFLRAYDYGKMDGFELARTGPRGPKPIGAVVGQFPQYQNGSILLGPIM